MNGSVYGKQIDKQLLILQSSRNNDFCKVLRPVPITTDNANNVIDYKNISLSLTGEVSSTSIHRNNFTQKRRDSSFLETIEEEEDDEEFMLNIKKKIDQNCKLNRDENCSLKELQSKSYSARRRKCVLSDEDENVMKRFKRSMNENKQECVTPQRLQTASVTFDSDMTTMNNTPMIAPSVQFNIDTNFGNDTNRDFFHVTSTMQKNDALINNVSENAKSFVTEVEIEQLEYCEMQCFTPPQKNN